MSLGKKPYRLEFSEDLMWFNPCRIALTSRLLFLAMIVPLGACRRSSSSVRVFATPDDAGTALLVAAKAGDHDALLAIFGADSKELISSGDAVQDKNAVAAFASGYEVM